jgi:hypothetical protein
MALSDFHISRALGEFAIIVFGVLAAFAVENWRDDQYQRELESEYLARLETEIRSDVERLDFTLQLGRAKVDALKTISAWSPGVNGDPEQMVRRLRQSVSLGWSLPALNTSTIEDLESTGNLGVIRDVGIRKAVLEYYRELRNVRERLERRMTRYPHHVYEIVPSDLLHAWSLTAVPLSGAADLPARRNTTVEFDSALYGPDLVRIAEDVHTDEFQRDLRAESNYARVVVDLLDAHRATAATLLEKL